MAWTAAWIYTIADSTVLLSLILFTTYFIYHLKFYASILWASLFTILAFVLLLVNNLAFRAKHITKLPSSWYIALAFSHGFDTLAFLLIVWASYKIMSPALPKTIYRKNHRIAKILWGLLIIPSIVSTVLYFVLVFTITMNARDPRFPTRLIAIEELTKATLNDRKVHTFSLRTTDFILVLRIAQFLAVAFLTYCYINTTTSFSRRYSSLTRSERFCISALTIPALSVGAVINLMDAAINVHISRLRPIAGGNWHELFSYVAYCLVSGSKIVIFAAMVVVIRSWVVANDEVYRAESRIRGEKHNRSTSTESEGTQGSGKPIVGRSKRTSYGPGLV